MLRRTFIHAGLGSVAVLAGCATPPPKPLVVPDRELQIGIVADAALNLDPRNRPAPLVVRVYVLRAQVNFLAADFFALFERDQATLGNDLLSREELQLRPGESRRLTRELKAEARALGVFAAYRDLEGAVWRALATLPEPPAPTRTPPPGAIPVAVNIALGSRAVRVVAQ